MVLCPYSAEEIDSVLPMPKHKSLPLLACYDADLSYDRVTRRLIGGVVGVVGKIIVIHKSKRHTSVETSTYGAELNAGRVGIEHCQEIRYMLRSLGAEVNLPTKHYGDNKSVCESCANENAKYKSRHSSVSYHKIRESVAAGIITLYHFYSE